MARILESTFINGPAGRLEALHEGPDDGVRIGRAAIVCHPHPLHGGTLHNKVVFRLARASRTAGSAVVRFNFRGVGQSAGLYDEGRGEQDDLRAVMGYVKQRYPGLPLSIAGFSFGSRVSLQVCCGEPQIDRVIPVGVPVGRLEFKFLHSCGCPKYFLHSTNDEFGPRDRMEEVYLSTADPKRIAWVEAADHFFSDALDELEAAAVAAFSHAW